MKLESLTRQIQVFVSDLKSPEAQSKRLAQVAAEGIAEIRRTNAAATGRRDFPPEVTVDGRLGAPLESVRPDGMIVAEFDLLRGVLEWIGEQLLLESPRLTGRYQESFVLIVDGVEHDMGDPIPSGDLYRFVNKTPYSAKIEPRGGRKGLSDQAPDGVFMAVSAVASKRFGNIARVAYSTKFFDPATGYMHPSITVRPL